MANSIPELFTLLDVKDLLLTRLIRYKDEPEKIEVVNSLLNEVRILISVAEEHLNGGLNEFVSKTK